MRFFAFIVACAAAFGCAVATSNQVDSHHRHRHHHRAHPLGLARRSASLRSANDVQAQGTHAADVAVLDASHHSDRKVVDGSVDGSVDASEDDALRPIITGCLKECGYKDQTCVTQCQVCIEQNECRILGKCDSCLREAHAQMVGAKALDKGVVDSGGVALVRDGLLADMTSAKLEALEWKRKLRIARKGVLEAQREAEWAAEERHAAAKKLEDSREALKSARLEVTRWKLQNAKKLKAKRARAQQQRQERLKAEQKLANAKEKYNKAEKKLHVASHANISANESASDEDNDQASQEIEGEEIWKLAKDVEERQTAVEQAETDVESTSADAEWLDRGLRRRVKSAQKMARTSREELLESRAMERVSRSRLQDAKDHYVKSVSSSEDADKGAYDSAVKLRNAPVNLYPGTNGTAPNATAPKAAALRSSSHLASGLTWLTLAAVLPLSWAI